MIENMNIQRDTHTLTILFQDPFWCSELSAMWYQQSWGDCLSAWLRRYDSFSSCFQ